MHVMFVHNKDKYYKGNFKLFGHKIDSYTAFDDLYDDPLIKKFTVKEHLTGKDGVFLKDFLQIRVKGYRVTLFFNGNGNELKKIRIESFIYDPKFNSMPDLSWKYVSVDFIFYSP